MDALIASALNGPLDHTPHRPTLAARAARVDWQKVDAILARVPTVPPAAGDEGVNAQPAFGSPQLP